jgi:hypothetical protein
VVLERVVVLKSMPNVTPLGEKRGYYFAKVTACGGKNGKFEKVFFIDFHLSINLMYNAPIPSSFSFLDSNRST